MAETIQFVDCSSLSVSFDATGKASVSIQVLRSDDRNIMGDYANMTWGGTRFELVVMNASPSPMLGTTWHTWSLQMEGVGY